jgi:hypothetical protein
LVFYIFTDNRDGRFCYALSDTVSFEMAVCLRIKMLFYTYDMFRHVPLQDYARPYAGRPRRIHVCVRHPGSRFLRYFEHPYGKVLVYRYSNSMGFAEFYRGFGNIKIFRRKKFRRVVNEGEFIA